MPRDDEPRDDDESVNDDDGDEPFFGFSAIPVRDESSVPANVRCAGPALAIHGRLCQWSFFHLGPFIETSPPSGYTLRHNQGLGLGFFSVEQSVTLV